MGCFIKLTVRWDRQSELKLRAGGQHRQPQKKVAHEMRLKEQQGTAMYILCLRIVSKGLKEIQELGQEVDNQGNAMTEP